MAPPVAHRPEGSCVNFPLCKKAQCKRKGDDGRQCRQPHRDTCSNRPVCSAPHCAQHVAPDGRNWKANGFCVEHIRAEEFEQYRDWSICQNSICLKNIQKHAPNMFHISICENSLSLIETFKIRSYSTKHTPNTK